MDKSLSDHINELADLVDDRNLRDTLKESVVSGQNSLNKVERCFDLLPALPWSPETLAMFLNSWKATHLKMLAIYGLSCRLQRLAMKAEENSPMREQLMLASARNAETSYEDLGLDYGGETHARLYNNFAEQLLGNFPWSLEKYCLQEAREFRGWIYENMVVSEIEIGLLTNMFSEIYNHAEYNIALNAFGTFIDRHYHFSTAERETTLQYIYAHVADETEVDHFLVVVKALEAYSRATDTTIDYQQVGTVFQEYLHRIGSVMESLIAAMERERNAAKNASIAGVF
ncbi:MAG: hypothetical protein J7647_27650 [Cyanobacteria bacterium SBLK]|nr:hypothetical protein [Cyanobacteria bacterium SBLK]